MTGYTRRCRPDELSADCRPDDEVGESGSDGGGAACAASDSASSGSWNCAAPSTNSSVHASSISSDWSSNGSDTNAGRFLTHLTDMKRRRAAASQTSSALLAAAGAHDSSVVDDDVIAPADEVDADWPTAAAAAAAVFKRY